MGGHYSKASNAGGHWKSDARHAMESGAFCVLCGAPFDLEGDVYNINPKKPRYQWLYRCRLLGHVEDLDRHRVTSGYARPVNSCPEASDLFLSEQACYSVAGSQYFCVSSEDRSSEIWFNGLSYTPDHGTLFPLHEACIQISTRVVDYLSIKHSKSGRPCLLVELYNLLDAQWQDSHSKQLRGDSDNTGNDIFDLCQLVSNGVPRSVQAMSKLEWCGGDYDRFYTNPIDVNEQLAEFVFRGLLSSYNGQYGRMRPNQTTKELSAMEGLPREILDMICSYVLASDIMALHRTSQNLFEKVPLNNAFWRTRLDDGTLLPYIWDLDTKSIEERHLESNLTSNGTNWDWRGIAKILATGNFPASPQGQELDDVPLGLWNRSRIWNIVQEAFEKQILSQADNSRKDSVAEAQPT